VDVTNRVETELLAQLERSGVELAIANDAARETFSVLTADGLLLVSGRDLQVLHEWRYPTSIKQRNGWGCHSIRSPDLLALMSTPDAVQMLEGEGSIRWSYDHASWAGIGSGCAWFDEAGRPFAVVPVGNGECEIVQLDSASGGVVAKNRIRLRDPAGMTPLHQGNGWIGVSESEGENAARAWWVRGNELESLHSRLEVIEADWDSEELTDVGPRGNTVLTTALLGGRLAIRSFPGLGSLRNIDIEDEEFHLGACFVGSCVVARLYRRQITVAIDFDNRLHELEVGAGWLVPAANSWLEVTRTGLRRWALK